MSYECNHKSDASLSNILLLGFFISVSSALLYFCLGFAYQNVNFPDEDAFILFIYSESLARHGEIAFFEGGPRTEGATDFLWMLLIAGFIKIGINAAVASQILNALGIFIAAAVFLNQSRRYPDQSFLFVAGAAVLPLMVVAHSGYVGFSAPLYSSIALLAFSITGFASPRHLWLVPLVSITLGLLRPDGVIMGVGFTLIALFYAKGARGRYVWAMLAAALIGLLYFAWRYLYFGQLLPLPLIVKSTFDGTPLGVFQTQLWWSQQFGYIIPALLYLVWKAATGHSRVVAAAVPIILLTAAIAMSEASQNILLRFQAPASLLALFLTLCLVAEILQMSAKLMVRASMAAVVLMMSFLGAGISDLSKWKNAITGLPYRTYADTFPIRLSQRLDPDARIALTEAGRFAYWTENETIDLVGLNTAAFALEGATPEDLREFDPDVVFLHTSELIYPECDRQNFCVMTGEIFAEFLFDQKLPKHNEVNNRVFRATLAGLEFLQENSENFDVVVAFFGGGYHHVYFLAKENGITTAGFTDLLRESFEAPREWSFVDAYNQFRR